MSQSELPGAIVLSKITDSNEYDDFNDCTLTSEEIQYMDLTKCRLVVLTSCFSGSGEVKTDGLLGLGRAFMYAGAQAVVLSLHAVKDSTQTVEFIEYFYKYYLETESASTALRKSMLKAIANNLDEDVWSSFYVLGLG